MPRFANSLRMALRVPTRCASVFYALAWIFFGQAPQVHAAEAVGHGSPLNFSEAAAQPKNSRPLNKRQAHYKRLQKMSHELPVSEKDAALASSAEQSVGGGGNSRLGARTVQGVFDESSPQPSASFLALDDDGTVAPPDTSGAAGPAHLIAALASEIRIQNKAGVSLSRLGMEDFWSGVSSNIFDTRVIYDPYGQRFIMTAAGDPGGFNPRLLIAVTQTTDPTGVWYRFAEAVDAVNPEYADSPQVGFNNKWIVVQANMFNETTFEFFRSEVFVYDRTNLYNGLRVRTKLAFDPVMGGSQIPATTFDPTNNLLYLVKNWNGNSLGEGYLRIFNVSGAIGAERLNVVNGLGNPTYVIGSDPWDSFAPGDADILPQLGTANK